MGRGRKQTAKDSSATEQDDDCSRESENGGYLEVKEGIKALQKLVSEGFDRIHADVDRLRYELKTEIKEVKTSLKDVEESLEATQGEVEELKEQSVKETSKRDEEIEALQSKIASLEKKLIEEAEQNISLEQYTRRENLRLNNIDETPHEDCKAKILGIIEQDFGIDISDMRFHAIHRTGKQYKDRIRPIIVRFVCREDRNKVWEKRYKIKESSDYENPYITEDYARASKRNVGY
ncbi:hypothetical protein QZH41_007938 [Actinostola sp. cb2023]|nr:hypothetical protein QZH41_007938 [Actinostola sp. cb2023]